MWGHGFFGLMELVVSSSSSNSSSGGGDGGGGGGGDDDAAGGGRRPLLLPPRTTTTRAPRDGSGSDNETEPHPPPPPLPEAVVNAQARGQVYIADLPADLGPARKLLERYSGIRARDVEEHIHVVVRD